MGGFTIQTAGGGPTKADGGARATSGGEGIAGMVAFRETGTPHDLSPLKLARHGQAGTWFALRRPGPEVDDIPDITLSVVSLVRSPVHSFYVEKVVSGMD